jgi:hypothetical protein
MDSRLTKPYGEVKPCMQIVCGCERNLGSGAPAQAEGVFEFPPRPYIGSGGGNARAGLRLEIGRKQPSPSKRA